MVYLRESRLVSLRGLYLHLTLQPQKRKLTLKQVTAIYIKSLIAGCIKLIKISYGAGALTDVGPQFLRLLSNGEPITSWVKDPWVVVGALHTGEQSNGLSWQLAGGEWASVR